METVLRLSLRPRLARLLKGQKRANFLVSDRCKPTPSAGLEKDANTTALVRFRALSIAVIFGNRHIAQIRDPVVCAVTVDVVN
jgi:hypothetical protein